MNALLLLLRKEAEVFECLPQDVGTVLQVHSGDIQKPLSLQRLVKKRTGQGCPRSPRLLAG